MVKNWSKEHKNPKPNRNTTNKKSCTFFRNEKRKFMAVVLRLLLLSYALVVNADARALWSCGSFSIIIVISIVFQFDAVVLQINSNAIKQNNNNNNNTANKWKEVSVITGVCVHETLRPKSAHKSITCRLFYGTIGECIRSIRSKSKRTQTHTHTQTKESKPILDKQIFKVSLLLWFYYGIFMVTRYVCPLIFLFIPCDHYECDRLVAIRTPIVWCGVLSVWRNAWMRCNCCLLPELNGYGGAEAVPPLFIFQS